MVSYPFYNNQGVSMPQMYPSNSINQQSIQQPIINNNLGAEIIRVHGISGAYQCNLPLGTKSILVVDDEKPLAYLITSDGINRDVQSFDIALHVDNQPSVVDVEEKVPSTNDILKEIKDKLNSMEGEINELKSNTTGSKSESKSKYDNKPNKSAKSNGISNETSH